MWNNYFTWHLRPTQFLSHPVRHVLKCMRSFCFVVYESPQAHAKERRACRFSLWISWAFRRRSFWLPNLKRFCFRRWSFWRRSFSRRSFKRLSFRRRSIWRWSFWCVLVSVSRQVGSFWSIIGWTLEERSRLFIQGTKMISIKRQ